MNRSLDPPGPLAPEAASVLQLDGRHAERFWCTPIDLEDLATGFLLCSGQITTVQDLGRVDVVPGDGGSPYQVRVERSGSPEQAPPLVEEGPPHASSQDEVDGSATERVVPGSMRFRVDAIQDAARTVMDEGPLRQATGGMHSAGALLPNGRLVLREDISRHIALMKAIGAAARVADLNAIAVLSSGRAAHEMVLRVAAAGIPLFATRGIPTTAAYLLAVETGITLVARVLSREPIVYCGSNRLDFSPPEPLEGGSPSG